MVPFLILSLGAIGLNILVGYTGLLSSTSRLPWGSAPVKLQAVGHFSGDNIGRILYSTSSARRHHAVGPASLRIKGYLAVATLAALSSSCSVASCASAGSTT